ncbi:MAG: hypothetical protein AB7U73_10790 [Pirellulales bacterium]
MNATRTRLSRHFRHARARSGYLLLEVATSAVLLTTLLLVVTSAVRMRLAAQRHADERQVARQEAVNLMERLTAQLPGGAVAATEAAESTAGEPPSDADRAGEVQLSDVARQMLPDARLRVDISPGDYGLQRVSIEIDWQLRSGDRSGPVRLVSWRRAATDSEEMP